MFASNPSHHCPPASSSMQQQSCKTSLNTLLNEQALIEKNKKMEINVDL